PGFVEFTADREGRIEAAVLQRDDEHRRRGGLAVGAGDQERAVPSHQRGEDRGAQQDRDAPLAGGDQFGIVLRDGRERRDQGGGTTLEQVESLGGVADADLRAAGPQREHTAALLRVGTRYLSPTG